MERQNDKFSAGGGGGGDILVQIHTATISFREENREILIFILDIPLCCTYKLHSS